MFRSNKSKIVNFRVEYANHADFCEVFKNEMKPLYLLAFLLTTNHKESEQCFASALEEAFKEQGVFKEWVRPWVKRRLIEIAIEIVLPKSPRNSEKRDLWSAEYQESQRGYEMNTVTKLTAFERFVFVMSILERYSNWDCSLLLECSMSRIAQARTEALRQLPELASPVPEAKVCDFAV